MISVHRRAGGAVPRDLNAELRWPRRTVLNAQTKRNGLAGPSQLLVAKDSVDYVLWNVLTEIVPR